MVGAAILVSHAYLPSWIFGGLDPADRIVPLIVFIALTLLGLAGFAVVGALDRMLNNGGRAPLRWRASFGLAAIMSSNGILLGLVFPPVFRLIMERDPRNVAGLWMMTSIVGAVAYSCHLMARTAQQQRKKTLHLQLETEQLAIALDRAELAMLEAQIEPHFLFNTLAHIKRQYRLDAGTADQMMSALIEYLDRAVPALRQADWTVGDELELIQVYLGLLQQRFGARLDFRIKAPDVARQMRLPALTITTLVENAVRHGLAPKPEGGSISVTAEMDDASVAIEVCDDGVGLRQSSGSGLGLATVRARLRSAFGIGAALRVEPRAEGGVRASIHLPARTIRASHAYDTT
jgi:sensor histidine kinase YesM